MKVSIGSKEDKKTISDVIRINVENGYSVFFDGEEYYVDVLMDGNVYRAPDTNLTTPTSRENNV